MKNSLKALVFFLLLVLAHQATAQKREPLQSWKDEFKYHLMSLVDSKDSLVAGKLADKLMAMSATEKSDYFHDHVVVSDQIKVTKAEVLNFTYGTPQLQTVNNAVMPIAFLRLGEVKEFVAGYGDLLLPMYTYKGKPDVLDYNPDIVLGYDFDGDGIADEAIYDQSTKKVKPARGIANPQNSPIAGQTAGGATTGNGQMVQNSSGQAGQQVSGTSQQGSGYVDPRYALVDVGGGQKKLLLMQPDGTMALADNTAQNRSAQSSTPPLPQSGSGWQMINYQGEDRMIIYTPNGPYLLPKEQAPKEDRVEIIKPGRHGVILNHTADGQAQILNPMNEHLTAMEIRRLYNLPDQTPTGGSLGAVAARNGLVYGAGGGAAFYQQVGISYQQPGYNVVPVGGGGCNGCYQHSNSFGPVACGSSLWGFR